MNSIFGRTGTNTELKSISISCQQKSYGMKRVRSSFSKTMLDMHSSAKSKHNLSHIIICFAYCIVIFRNPSEIVVRHRGNDSTSCLLTHVRKCEPEATISRDIMERFASGCTYQNEEFHILCLKWIIKGCRPYSIVEDKELRMMFQMCLNNVKIPRQNTISRHIKIFYSMCFKKVVSTLRNYNGAIHIGLDAWTAGNGMPFLGITLHRCIDGTVLSTVLDFIHLTDNHTGYYLATEVQKCLERFGLESKLCAIAGDNASNNEKMIRCLALRLSGWGGKTNQVRCLGHILSLAMQVCLR